MNINGLSASTVQATNTVAVAATAASIMEWLPPILAVVSSTLAIVWFIVELYESHTFKRFVIWLKNGEGE